MQPTKKKVNRNSNFIKTHALLKYRENNGLSNSELADKVGNGVKPGTVSYWCKHGTVPHWVINCLGLRTWGGKRVKNEKSVAPPAMNSSKVSEIYLAYIDRDKEPAFKAFCAALNINIKTVL